jgi:hypothetical protein
MPTTPKDLLDALDLVTFGAPPMLEAAAAFGEMRSRHFAKLDAIQSEANFVGFGVSAKRVEGRDTNELALSYYVRKKLPLSRLRASAMVPPVISIDSGKSVFTDVVEIGKLQLEALSVRRTPIKSGFSVAHVAETAGTVGAIVRKGGKSCVLSNSHVLARSGRAAIGDKVLYPGKLDGGAAPADLLGTLLEFVPFDTSGQFVNRVDAALAEIASSRLSEINRVVHLAATPIKTIKPERGMKVAKFGRTTGATTGEIRDVNFRFKIIYPGVGSVGYIDQVLCTRYTDGGDSGSIVVDTESGKVVGLHFCGAEGGSVFNPIQDVKAALGFSFLN